jgi:serine O-acetyltransferase
MTKPLALMLSLINFVFFGLEVTPRCSIGPGLILPHTHGTVIGANRIGCNSTIFQGVTLGAKYADLEFDPSSRPVVGDNVTLGAGAKVLGGIKIGNRAIIAANSLVVTSVPDNAFMIGVPAEQRGNGHAA